MNLGNKKYNKLSIIAFVLVIIGFLITYIKFLASAGSLLALVGFILGTVSYFEIKKTGEKGKGLLIALFIIFILIIVSMGLLYLPIKSFK